jgi:hypothetical protein
MGTDRHTSRNRKAAKNRPTAQTTRPTTRRRPRPRAVAPLTPRSIPWSTCGELDSLRPAVDGTYCVPFEAEDTNESGFAVFDAEGLLRELIVLVGPPGLGDDDEALLRGFVIERRALEDPAFEFIPVDAAVPMQRKDVPLVGPRELHYWCYQPFDPAADGSRSIVVCDGGGFLTLMVVDRDGGVIDGMCIDVIRDYTGKGCRAWVELRARRREVDDPYFRPRSTNAPASGEAR